MSKELFSLFLLFTPGIMANEILIFLGKSKRTINLAYLINCWILNFIILGSSVLVKYLLGGGSEVFTIISDQYFTVFLTKYIVLSCVFSLLYPIIFLMIVHLNENRKSQFHEK